MTRLELDMESDTSLIVASGAGISSTLQRSFNYELSDKKAKSNFLKSAAREALEVEEKQLCTMMSFSVGSYLEVVIPTVIDWNNSRNKFSKEDNGVEDVLPSFDEKGKHVESVIRFRFKREKITVTCYYTTQRIKVEGKGYILFVTNFLQPLFQQRISQVLPGKIEKWNKEVIAYLSGKRKVVSRPMRSVKYKSINFSCAKCETTFSSNAQMKKHMKIVHTNDLDDTPETIGSIPMVDSISLLDVSMDQISASNQITLEERNEEIEVIENAKVAANTTLLEDITCRKCNFEATDENILKNHIRSCHENEKSNPEASKFTCQSCEYITSKKQEIEEHMRSSHGPERLQKCQQCKFSSTSKTVLDDHVQKEHVVMEQFKCELCAKTFSDKENLTVHVNTTHVTENFRCHTCKFVTTIKTEIENHNCNVSNDGGKVLEKCDMCGYEALHESDLRIHKQTLHDSQNLVLKALQQLTENVRTLTQDVLDLKSNSIIIEKEIFSFVKSDIIEHINKNTDEKFGQVWEKITDVQAGLEKLETAQKKAEDAGVDKERENKASDDPIEKLITTPKKSFGKTKEKRNKKKMTWFGTSLSNSLDTEKLEKDTNMDVNVVKAFCIKPDGKYPDLNFTDTVPAEIEHDIPDIVVLEAGSIEITNLDVKKAMMDTNKDVKEYEREWTEKVEKDSENLFNLALKMTEEHKHMKIIILKRLPRFDTKAQDPTSIKSRLSVFANNVYDQLYFKSGCPSNIKVADLNLATEYPYLRKIIMGNPEAPEYDGIHLRGSESSRHFTYRAGQLIKSSEGYARAPRENLKNTPTRYFTPRKDYDHTNCPQARYQRDQYQFSAVRGNKSVQSTQSVQSAQYVYNVPTKNSFHVLGN